MPKLGRGVTPIRMALAQYLATNYQIMRQRAIREWPAEPESIPQILVFSPYDNIDMNPERSPILGVDANRANRFAVSGIANGEYEHRPRYNIRLNLWLFSPNDVTGTSKDKARIQAIQRRDDMVAITRACLFDKPTLGTDFLAFDKATYTEDYNPAFASPTTSQRYFAGAQLTFDVQSDDWLTDTSLGEVHEIIVDPKAVSNQLLEEDDPFNLGKIS